MRRGRSTSSSAPPRREEDPTAVVVGGLSDGAGNGHSNGTTHARHPWSPPSWGPPPVAPPLKPHPSDRDDKHHRGRRPPPPPPPRGLDRVLVRLACVASILTLVLALRVQPEFGHALEPRHAFRAYLLAHARDINDVRVPLDVIPVDQLNRTSFFSRMYRGEPFIVAGAAAQLPARERWVGPEGDAYLRAVAGDAVVSVERSADGLFADFVPGWRKEETTLGAFLDELEIHPETGAPSRSRAYLAEADIPEALLGDVPHFDFADFLDPFDDDARRKVWLSRVDGDVDGDEDGSTGASIEARRRLAGGGGVREDAGDVPGADGAPRVSQSLPHTDNFENVLVQLEGAKDIVLVPPAEGLLVYPGGWSPEARRRLPNHYSPVDFHAPDRDRHPKFQQANPVTVRLVAGDALYLPSFWWHHVRAGGPGRNLAVNFWYPTVSAAFRTAMDGMEADAY